MKPTKGLCPAHLGFRSRSEGWESISAELRIGPVSSDLETNSLMGSCDISSSDSHPVGITLENKRKYIFIERNSISQLYFIYTGFDLKNISTEEAIAFFNVWKKLV